MKRRQLLLFSIGLLTCIVSGISLFWTRTKPVWRADDADDLLNTITRNNHDNRLFKKQPADTINNETDTKKAAVIINNETNIIKKASDIMKNATTITKKATDIMNNGTDIKEASDIMNNETNIIKKASDIRNNATDIIKKATDILNNGADIKEASDIMNNETDIKKRFTNTTRPKPGDRRCTEDIQLRPRGTFPMVALASFPGSGNTWVRYLIERATGYYTGSYYYDDDLYKNGFRGELERWTNGTTVVVKTHRFDQKHVEAYYSAILIVRDPYKAMIAEHNRKFGGHTGHAPEGQYKKGTEWTNFVTGKSRAWADTAINFLQYSKKVLVIYYEDLQTDLYDNLVKIVDFLGLPVDENRLLCVLEKPLGKFKRPPDKRKQLTFDPFTEEMRKTITLYVKGVCMALKLKDQRPLPAQYDPKAGIS